MAYKAFVSSTFEDLKDHRAHVIRSLRRAGFVVDPMEDWTADSDEPKKFSQARLDGCDLCVLLVAFRRGYVPDGETRSITQLEYDTAVKQGIDIVPFVLAEDTPWSRKFDELDKDPDIRTWREHLRRSHGVESFALDPRSIDLTGVLGRWLTKKKAIQPEAGKIERIAWPESKSPYPGLLSFGTEYAPLFFGRDREVDDLIGKMREPGGRAHLISGASGAGKSSVIAAGVWQAIIKEGRLPGNTQWVWHRIQPSEGETTPFDALALGLKQALQLSDRPDFTATGTTLKGVLSKRLDQGQELILFVDQLEELFTRGFKEPDILDFLNQLIGTAQDKANRLRVVAAMRSEFVGRLEAYECTLTILNQGFNYHLGPVSRRVLQDMIKNPAQATGYEFEPGLIDRILNDAGEEPGHLPLVAYALNQLFERRKDRTFTADGYKTIGGVAGAIGTKADQVLNELGEEVRGAVDKVFAELVHIDRERPPTRKRVSLGVFKTDQAANQLIDALAGQECRILVRGGEEPEATVEVAHEKLFTAWPRLQEWIKACGEDLHLIEYATEAAHRWDKQGGQPQELWLGPRANEVLVALQRFHKKPGLVLERFLKPQDLLIEHLSQDSLSHKRRALFGRILSEFGDLRPGVGLADNGLPDIVWVAIPGGKICLGGVAHVFEVKPFYLARYPVTNIQYQAFIDDGGYKNEKWWRGFEKQNLQPSSWQESNVPRETVSWYEAVAYCRWLSHQTKTRIRLPTEWEWQQAATGGDPKRSFPWSGRWDESRCNSWESRLYRTSTVGIYPHGATQQGVMEMAGNVWEWCSNTYENPERPEAVHRNNLADKRVIRGGSWRYRWKFIYTSWRSKFSAISQDDNIGFRLAQDLEP